MKKYTLLYTELLAVLLLMMASCVGRPDIPSSAQDAKCLPNIFPDYCNVTIPCNIAPLNFMLPTGEYSECVARYTLPDGTQQTYGHGVKVQVPEEKWQEMRDASVGKSIKVEVWGKKNGKWLSFDPFTINVAKDPIDEYLSYRLIEPSYIVYDYMEIDQRTLTTFDESQIFNNKVACDDPKGQCINCHSYQNYKTDNMLFHARVTRGGTVLVNNGKITKVNLKRDYTISAGVYPAWHPAAGLIAFSANSTHQVFRMANRDKVEVYDSVSDLVLYDVNNDSVSIICNDPDLLEVFPTWSPDGKYLYYCKTISLPEDLRDKDIRSTYSYLKYNVYRRSFDLTNRNFGDEELIYDAASLEKSVSLPRISPDGRYLLFALGSYGCFHIWHHDADIVCLPLNQLEDAPFPIADSTKIDLSGLNSEGFADSYPSWSSNGHWIMCASRRDDGNYSRVYFSYFHDGKVEKAFELPQQDPEHNTWRLKSYNRPEFMVEPVKISAEEFSKVFDK